MIPNWSHIRNTYLYSIIISCEVIKSPRLLFPMLRHFLNLSSKICYGDQGQGRPGSDFWPGPGTGNFDIKNGRTGNFAGKTVVALIYSLLSSHLAADNLSVISNFFLKRSETFYTNLFVFGVFISFIRFLGLTKA